MRRMLLGDPEDVLAADVNPDLVPLVPAHRLRDPLGDRDDESVADAP